VVVVEAHLPPPQLLRRAVTIPTKSTNHLKANKRATKRHNNNESATGIIPPWHYLLWEKACAVLFVFEKQNAAFSNSSSVLLWFVFIWCGTPGLTSVFFCGLNWE
jgi:hypothetical protein